MKRLRSLAAALAFTVATSAGAAHAQTRVEQLSVAGPRYTGRTSAEVLGNTATVTQYGSNNAVHLRQIGSDLNADIAQYNDNNYVQMIQVGRGLDAQVIQTGGQRLFVVQTPNGVVVRPIFRR